MSKEAAARLALTISQSLKYARSVHETPFRICTTGKLPCVLVDEASMPRINFGAIKYDFQRMINPQQPMPPKIISVFGDSQKFDAAGSQLAQEVLGKTFTRQKNGAIPTILFGLTGHSGTSQRCVNGSVSHFLQKNPEVPAYGQAVDQTLMAIEKWGCDTVDPTRLDAIIYVHGSMLRAGCMTNGSRFSADVALDGQLNTALLDKLLTRSLKDLSNLPKDLGRIIGAYIDKGKRYLPEDWAQNPGPTAYSTNDRLMLMQFATRQGMDLSSQIPLEEILFGPLSDAGLVLSGGMQASEQLTTLAVSGKPITGVAGLRGPDNPACTIKVGPYNKLCDFLDGAQYAGYLAHTLKQHPQISYSEASQRYHNGTVRQSLIDADPLTQPRMPYNPKARDVALMDAASTLNTKLAMNILYDFALGCLGGYRKIDPDAIDISVLCADRQTVLPYDKAALKGEAPTFNDPMKGLYHDKSVHMTLNGQTR